MCQSHFRLLQLHSTTLTMQKTELNIECHLICSENSIFHETDKCSYFRTNFIRLESDISDVQNKL